ncbi:hypothetical protein SRABI03_03179 [Microbacterium foliorum]|nr:hypothetical protein SRABI03_03179 [Microbacterium foliorum]
MTDAVGQRFAHDADGRLLGRRVDGIQLRLREADHQSCAFRIVDDTEEVAEPRGR